MTETQRNAVVRLIEAAETVVADFEAGNLTETRFTVQRMKQEIQVIRQPELTGGVRSEFGGGGR